MIMKLICLTLGLSRVSSVLNGDKKMYGKTFLFDGSDETCWNSDKVFKFKFVCCKEVQM